MSKGAIAKKYKGVVYRSTLEAKYAAFFDLLGLDYQYESDEIDTGIMGWLPDFVLVWWGPDEKAERELFVEVKPVSRLEACPYGVQQKLEGAFNLETRFNRQQSQVDTELWIAPGDLGTLRNDSSPAGWWGILPKLITVAFDWRDFDLEKGLDITPREVSPPTSRQAVVQLELDLCLEHQSWGGLWRRAEREVREKAVDAEPPEHFPSRERCNGRNAYGDPCEHDEEDHTCTVDECENFKRLEFETCYECYERGL